MLDQGRLLELRDKTNRMSIISSVLLLVNNIAGPAIQGISSFKKQIKDHLNVILESVHSNKLVIMSKKNRTNFPSTRILTKKKTNSPFQRFGNCDAQCFITSQSGFESHPRGNWRAFNAA